MDRYQNIKTKENYDKLLKSGMFWEFHPELTGDWNKDKEVINKLSIHNVSVSFLYDFVNEFTDTEIPKEAIKETLDKLNER